MKKIFIYVMIAIGLIAIGLFVYVNFIVETHYVTFNSNGATIDGSELIPCTKDLQGCYVIMPNATRVNGRVWGYSKDKDATNGTYNIGDKVYIKDDLTLYAISDAINTVTIVKTDVDYLENDTVSCAAHNLNTSCEVRMPLFNKLGYQISGYGTSSSEIPNIPSQYYPNETYQISDNLTLYPKYTSDRQGKNVKYDTKEYMKINGSIVEVENDKTNAIINAQYSSDFLMEISDKAPYLFTGQKITFLDKDTMKNVWLSNGEKEYDLFGVIFGMSYGSTIEGHPLSRSIDIFGSSYDVLVSIMTMCWDLYYPYKINGKIGNISDIDYNNFDNSMGAYNKVYGIDRISAQPDIITLYNKYQSMSKDIRPFDDDSYKSTMNFFASMMKYYYLKYLVPKDKYKVLDYPDDIKTVLEKYICIASHDYQVSACK